MLTHGGTIFKCAVWEERGARSRADSYRNWGRQYRRRYWGKRGGDGAIVREELVGEVLVPAFRKGPAVECSRSTPMKCKGSVLSLFHRGGAYPMRATGGAGRAGASGCVRGGESAFTTGRFITRARWEPKLVSE